MGHTKNVICESEINSLGIYCCSYPGSPLLDNRMIPFFFLYFPFSSTWYVVICSYIGIFSCCEANEQAIRMFRKNLKGELEKEGEEPDPLFKPIS